MENFKITDRTYRFWILKITLFLADISNLVKLLSFFDPQKPWKYKQIWGLRSLSQAKTTKTVQFQQWQEVLRHSFVFNQKPIVESKICSWGGKSADFIRPSRKFSLPQENGGLSVKAKCYTKCWSFFSFRGNSPIGNKILDRKFYCSANLLLG